MSDMVFQLQDELHPILKSGDTALCEQIVAQRLATLPRSPFQIAIDLSITNIPTEVAALFNGFRLALLAQGSLDYD